MRSNVFKRLAAVILIGVTVLVVALAVHRKFSNDDILERNIYEMTDEEYEEYCDAYYEKYDIPAGDRIEELIDYDEKLKNIPSDIEGMSQYDKKEMGLFVSDGSDTDGDGLTDKEEIEIYGSDPLKSSTAGDLYYDSYKVEHGMDLHTYYEYEGEFSFRTYVYDNGEKVYLNQFADSINLYPTAPESTYAFIKQNDFIIPENFNFFQGFYIGKFTGTLSFDFSAIDTLQNISDFDILVMNEYEGNLYFCDYETKDELVYLDYEFNSQYNYYIVVGLSHNSNKILQKLFHSSVGYTQNYSGLTNSKYVSSTGQETYLIAGSPLLLFLDIPVKIYYASQNEPSKIEDVKVYTNYVINGSENRNLPFKVKKHSFWGLNIKRSVLQHIFPSFEVNGINFQWYHLFFCYFDYDTAHLNLEIAREEEERLSHFLPEFDELPFKNFKSQRTEKGNCAGIAHLTSYLYNNKEFPSSGSYMIEGEHVEWDLTTDEENSTLMDRGLADYKDSSFVKKHKDKNKYLTVDLSNGEWQFVNMITCYWKESNDRTRMSRFNKDVGDAYSYHLIEKMMAYIDNGKILDMYLLFDNGSKHVVNVYDYYYDNNGDFFFRVYDNNYPFTNIVSDAEKFNSFVIAIQVDYNDVGEKIFNYTYAPITKNSNYRATSIHGFKGKFCMAVIDDQWNILNDATQ